MPTKSSISAAFSVSMFIVYSEYDYVLIYSKLGILKFRSQYIYAITHNTNISLCSSLFLNKYICNGIVSCSAYIQDLFRSTCFGFFAKYRMKGLGHRIFVRKSSFIFKLGYSHFIYKLLSLDLKHNKKRNKKKPFFAIRGMNLVNVRNSMFTIQSYRLPNCYYKNGILVLYIIVVF
jgi:ribosomal protein L6P/L9E